MAELDDKAKREMREREIRERDTALLEANPALYGVDVADPEYKGPNGIYLASIGPILPKAAGELKNLIEENRLVERRIDEDDAIVREGEGLVVVGPAKGEGFQAKTAEEDVKSRGEKKGEELRKAEAPRKEEDKQRFEEGKREKEEAAKKAEAERKAELERNARK